MESQTISYGKALYYPHINLTDNAWIKTASLFYKGLSRIVPPGFELYDNEIINKLNEKEEFISNITPDYYPEEIGFDFLDFAQTELADTRQRKKLIKKLGLFIPKDFKIRIYGDKLPVVLKRELPLLGLADKNRKYDWYNFEPVTGAIYMTFLANRIAEDNKLPIVTDNPIFQPLIRCCQNDYLQQSSDIAETLASVVINSTIPENIENIPISKILKFRQNYDDERHLFYSEINSLVSELRKVDKEDLLKECLEFKRKDIEIAVNNLDKAYRGIGISTATAMLGLSIPAFATGLGAAIATGGIISIATGKLISEGINYYKMRKESPYSYVLLIKNRLKSETLAQQLVSGKLIF